MLKDLEKNVMEDNSFYRGASLQKKNTQFFPTLDNPLNHLHTYTEKGEANVLYGACYCNSDVLIDNAANKI